MLAYLPQLIVPGLSVKALILFILATPVQFYVGASFYVNGWKSLRKLSPSMDVLIALGTSAAYFTSTVSLRSHFICNCSR